MSNNSNQTKLIVLSAPSGTGKTTLTKMLLNDYSNEIKLSISHTTRKSRGTEINGKDYYFIEINEFEKMISNNDFLEYAHVFNQNYYGTSKSFVENTLNNGQSVLFDIDVQGAFQIKSKYKEKCLLIFILPPSIDELEKRLRTRNTDSDIAIQKRLKTAKMEIEAAKNFDIHITNDDLKRTYSELVNALIKNGCIQRVKL